jgi:hypothetical protein
MNSEERAKAERRYNWLFSELRLLKWQLEHGGRTEELAHVNASLSCLTAGHNEHKRKNREESFKA